MKSRNDKVLEWAVTKAAKEYRDDVAILAVYGSYVNGTSDELSDVDFFFIPKTERGLGLSRTFIIEGVGSDLFPMSWERVQGLSEFREPLAPLLGDSQIVFASSKDDERRFLSLRGNMQENLLDMAFMHERAAASLNKGSVYLRKLRFQHDIGACRLLAGRMLLCLSDAVAYKNQTYFKKGLKNHFHDLSCMSSLPQGFLEAYDGIVGAENKAGLLESAEKMASCCRAFLGFDSDALHEPEPCGSVAEATSIGEASINHDELVSFYEETVSTFNKVWRSCEGATRNCRNAFIAGICLQRVLDEEVPMLGLDVLSSFACSSLDAFLSAAHKAESVIISAIEKEGPLMRYKSAEEFLSCS